jgi:Methyltransferase domain
MTAHAYLDKFSVLGQCVYLEGWASDFSLELFYDDEPISLLVQPVHRPDVASVFGDGSERWGFVACGILPNRTIDHAKFRLRFNSEIEYTSPQDHFSAAADQAFVAMINTFQQEIKVRRGSLLEIGSRARSGTTYRSWFPEIEQYVGLDVTDGPNVDIVGDAHQMSEFIDRKFDFVFSIGVFEHILMPWKVAIEMNSVMADGGMGLIISHEAWPLHEEPWDFWRYSKEAWQGIFNIHTGFEIVDAKYQFPASIVPFWIHTQELLAVCQESTYLSSGCLIRKIGPCKVSRNGNVSEVYDLAYSHKGTELERI